MNLQHTISDNVMDYLEPLENEPFDLDAVKNELLSFGMAIDADQQRAFNTIPCVKMDCYVFISDSFSIELEIINGVLNSFYEV